MKAATPLSTNEDGVEESKPIEYTTDASEDFSNTKIYPLRPMIISKYSSVLNIDDPFMLTLAGCLGEMKVFSIVLLSLHKKIIFKQFLCLPYLLVEVSFSKEQIEIFRASFPIFDADGSGTIDSEEMMKVLRSFGVDVKKEKLQHIIDVAEMEGSRDGKLNFEEFLRSIQMLQSGHGPETQDEEESSPAVDADDSGENVRAKNIGEKIGKIVVLSL